MNNTSENFKKNKFAIVRLAIPQDIADLVTQYTLFDEIQNFCPDIDHVVGAHSKYADPLMETLLLKLHKQVEETTGLTLLPTYSYFRVYRPGDELSRHQDRPACEVSVTVCFNFCYNDPAYSWPIFMAGTSVDLQPGDLAVYRGIDIEHWREKFTAPGDAWHVQGFFHYVDANGPHTEWKFDKRSNIGNHMAVPEDPQYSEEDIIARQRRAEELGFRPRGVQQLPTPSPEVSVPGPGLKSYISFTS